MRHLLRRPRTTQELRQHEAARVDGLPCRAKRRGLPTAYDDVWRGKPRRDKRRPWRER